MNTDKHGFLICVLPCLSVASLPNFRNSKRQTRANHEKLAGNPGTTRQGLPPVDSYCDQMRTRDPSLFL